MTEKIEKLLLYVGTAGAIISAVAYLTIMIVLVVGIEVKMHESQLIIIAVAGGLAGLMITNMLRTQGVALAANTEESKKVMKKYHATINKTKDQKKLRTIKFHMIKELLLDIITKALTIALSTYFMVSIFMEGNGDYSLIALAISNILMFISFGILALRKSYQFYTEEHLAAITELTNRILETPIIVKQNDHATPQKEIKYIEIFNKENYDQVGSVPLKEN